MPDMHSDVYVTQLQIHRYIETIQIYRHHINMQVHTYIDVCVSMTCLLMYRQCSYGGWLQSVGSIKLQVSFAEYRLFYSALLQKRPIILSILLTKANVSCPVPVSYIQIYIETILIYRYVETIQIYRYIDAIQICRYIHTQIHVCL